MHQFYHKDRLEDLDCKEHILDIYILESYHPLEDQRVELPVAVDKLEAAAKEGNK